MADEIPRDEHGHVVERESTKPKGVLETMMENLSENMQNPDAYDDWRDSITNVEPLTEKGNHPKLNEDGTLADENSSNNSEGNQGQG